MRYEATQRLTPAGFEHVGDPFRCARQEDSPVEAEDNQTQKGRHDDLIDRLNRSHSPQHRQPGYRYGDTVEKHWPVGVLKMERKMQLSVDCDIIELMHPLVEPLLQLSFRFQVM